MSRNLGQTNCDHCKQGEVRLTGERHPITREEAGRYFDEYEGLVVANAECKVCKAQYIAWCDFRPCQSKWHKNDGAFADPAWDIPFFDLSYRSTFNDEPDEKDLVYDVEWVPKLQSRR